MSVMIGAELQAFAAANLAAAGSGLVTIPNGTFLMGSETGNPEEKPVHEATVSTFRMCADDVTNERYWQFVEGLGERRVALIAAHPDTGVERVLALGSSEKEVRSAVDNRPVSQLIPGAGDMVAIGGMKTFMDSMGVVTIGEHKKSFVGFDGPQQPVVGVSWYDAFVYAYLHGGMLPTEWQWEYAARVVQDSSELRAFATLSGGLTKDQAHYEARETADVGSYPRLPNGLGDMCGNVLQWMQNWYAPYAEGAVIDPTGPRGGDSKTVRGGSWLFLGPETLRATSRLKWPPVYRHFNSLGFRWVAAADSKK